MCAAFVAAYFALNAEIARRNLAKIDPYSVVAYVAIAGIIGAKLWHVIDTPGQGLTAEILHRPVAVPSFLAGWDWTAGLFTFLANFIDWFRGGFAWFGGFVAGIATLLLLARHYRINWLTMLDIASPAAAIGYAVGRIGCLISGDGDYGMPTHLPWGMAFPDGLVPTTQTCVQWGAAADCRVHPTPIYEFLVGMLIFWYIWRRGARALRHPLAPGVITGEFLIMSGLARFLVEFIRINPRVLWGMSNAQVSALLTAIAGLILLVIVRRRFRNVDPVHKVLDHVIQHGNRKPGRNIIARLWSAPIRSAGGCLTP